MVEVKLRPRHTVLSANHTWTRKFATGVSYHRYQFQRVSQKKGYLNLNFLVHRENGRSSQANFYLLGAVGGVDDAVNGVQFGYEGGVQVDYETRSFYTLFKARFEASETLNAFSTIYRIGFAPYLADSGDLHTFAILQLNYEPQVFSTGEVIPMLRFFYKTVLWEVGASLRGAVFFQFMLYL